MTTKNTLLKVLLLLTGLALTPMQVFAQSDLQGPQIITVKGEAEITVPPDYIRVTFGHYEEGKRIPAIKEELDEVTQQVLDVIPLFNIAESDFSLSGIEIEARHEYDRNDNGELIGYILSREFEVQFHDIANYEALSDALVQAGIKHIDRVSSEVNDEDALTQQALKAAAQNAQLKAENIVAGLGAELGHIVEIGENSINTDYYFSQNTSNQNQRYSGANEVEGIVSIGVRRVFNQIDFKPEDITVSGTVWVRFAIKQGAN